MTLGTEGNVNFQQLTLPSVPNVTRAPRRAPANRVFRVETT